MYNNSSKNSLIVSVLLLVFCGFAVAQAPKIDFNDAHFHLTNYIQEGLDMHDFLKIMDEAKTGRVAVFGLPLQQQWSYFNSGDLAPTYYLHTDAPLYYYSFTDAYIAMQYKALTKEQQARFDPMITGFNPTDMYAVDHIKRVLRTFPGVFSGVGEFSVHKEFVSGKVAGETASLLNPALDRIFDFCAESGLVVIFHNDLDVPFAKPDSEPAYLAQMKDLYARHPKTTILWAHVGMGRIVRPVKGHAAVIEAMLKDSKFDHVIFDLSWDETAKYLTSSPEAIKITADLLNRYPDRFIFGSDDVFPKTVEKYTTTYRIYRPVWKELTAEAKTKILKTNYERIFDQARQRVRTWEEANVKIPQSVSEWPAIE